VWVDGATGTDDEAACTGPDAPCADVMYALDTYVGDGLGGVVNVAGGSDYGRLHLRSNGPNHGGTLETPTVVRAWPGTGRPAFSSSTNWALGTCCSDVSADNFVFEGLEVTEAIEAGVHIHGENVDRAEIRDCLVRGVRHEETVRYPNQTAGIVITNQPTGVLLVGNRIEDNVAVGVAEDGSPAPVHGIAITNTEGGMTLERNVVIGNAGSGIYVGNAGHTIIGNRISRNGESGILFVNARETLVEDNQICDVGAVGLDIVNSDLLRVSHNTVVGSGAQGLLLTSFSDDNVVVGNLFADNAGAGMERTAEPGDPEDFDNLFWMNATDRISIDPDGTVWDDEIEPFFRDREGCDLTLIDGPAASLVDGGPVGSRVVFAE
jgi:parallel beta-helix repeat protein